jgi:hypothetical protein
MRKSIALIGLILPFALVASAQDYPRMETFLGYTYVRANSATNVPSFSANGAGGQFGYNFNKYISVVADIGAVHNGSLAGLNVDSTTVNFLFGPRFSFGHSRIRPYINTLFGGAYYTGSTRVRVGGLILPPIYLPGNPVLPIIPGQPVTARIGGSQTGFAMVVGGGLDIKLSRYLSFRPIGADYYLTRLQNLRTLDDNNQNNFRYTAGFNFTFGGAQ